MHAILGPLAVRPRQSKERPAGRFEPTGVSGVVTPAPTGVTGRNQLIRQGAFEPDRDGRTGLGYLRIITVWPWS